MPSAWVGGLIRSGPHLEQLFAAHPEEAHRVLVALDEAAAVDVEHDDRLGRVLDEGPVAGFTVAQRGFGTLAVAGVAQADHVHVALAETDPGHAEFRIELGAVAIAALDLARGQVELSVVDRLGQFVQRLGQTAPAGQRGDQQVETATSRLFLGKAEDPLADGVQGMDAPVRVHGQDRVLDVVEHDLQLRARVIARTLPARVAIADRLEQPAQVQLAVRPAALLELLLEECVQAHRALVPAIRSRDRRMVGGRGTGEA